MLSEHSNVTLVGDDDAIMLTKWFFDLRVRFSGKSWVLSEHSHVTLVGDDDAIMLTKVIVTRTVRMKET